MLWHAEEDFREPRRTSDGAYLYMAWDDPIQRACE